MIGFYTFGGGRGHLTRVRKFIDYLNLVDFKILTGSKIAYSIFNPEEIIFYQPKSGSDPLELKVFITELIKNIHFHTFYIDCFPGGILGELTNSLFHGISVYHLARRLNPSYSLECSTDPIQYISTYTFEELSNDHLQHLAIRSKEIIPIRLPLPEIDLDRSLDERVTKSNAPIWLIVHSNPPEEIEVLLMQAKILAEKKKKSPLLVIFSDSSEQFPKETILINDESRPFDYFPIAEKIFSAAGFNCIHEINGFKEKHICVPFTRKYDDQIWRSKNY